MEKDLQLSKLALVGQQRLLVNRTEVGEQILILEASGRALITIDVTERGPILRLDGASLAMRVSGTLAIDAADVLIHGRDSLKLSCGGDATIAVAGDLSSSARIQRIRAELGNVEVKANDDVRLTGERILLNC